MDEPRRDRATSWVRHVMPLLPSTGVLVVAGKGGVGKSTVTAVLARAAAAEGRRVLVVGLDGKPALARLVGDVPHREVTAAQALHDYLGEHGLGKVARRLNRSGVIDVVSTAAPGIDDIVVLGRVKQLERSGEWDLVIVDGPAAGHAVTMLTAAAGLRDAVRGGPVRKQADEVLELLVDPERCAVTLVTLPETTPVLETVETAFALEDRVGVRLTPVVVNRVDVLDAAELAPLTTAYPDEPALARAASFRDERRRVQRESVKLLASRLPLDQVQLPHRAGGVADPAAVDELVAALAEQPASTRSGRADRGRPAGAQRLATEVPGVAPADTAAPAAALFDADTDVIVCAGPGGVGKTTAAAAVGLEAARRGRRVVVVTIDPAKRLGDALGLVDGLGAEPQRVDLRQLPSPPGRAKGGSDRSGELWAMMLDPAVAFTRVIEQHAEPDQAARIVGNAFFRNLVESLSGTQEYMAAETLHELHRDERFDLVVVDTPPTRNALDFLAAPGVLARFLDHKLFRLIMLPTTGGLRLLGAATQPLLKTIGKVVGSDVLSDVVVFFQAFAGLEGGFRQRAEEVTELLRSATTRYVVVAAPQTEALEEATWFAGELGEQGLAGEIVGVLNRVTPEFGQDSAEAAEAAATDAADAGDGEAALLWGNVAELRAARAAELDAAAGFGARLPNGLAATVPLLAGDVHDTDGLGHVAEQLFAAAAET